MKHLLIPLNQKNVWDNHLASFPHHYYAHTHWYNAVMQLASKRDIFLYVGEEGDFKALCPLSKRQKASHDPYDICSPYGFSGFILQGTHPHFYPDWCQFMLAQGFVSGHIALHPFSSELSIFPPQEFSTGKQAYSLDLQTPLLTIHQNFAVDHRHRLRQWQKLTFTVETEKTCEAIDIFIDLYQQSLKSRQASSIYDFGREAWQQLINEPHSHLFYVKSQEKIEASAIFIAYQDQVDYFMIASTDAGRMHARGIIWEAIQFFKNLKFKWLHLGCGIKENDALEQFKSRFGAQPFQTFALKQIYDVASYQQLCNKYNCDHENTSGYFPIYWQ